MLQAINLFRAYGEFIAFKDLSLTVDPEAVFVGSANGLQSLDLRTIRNTYYKLIVL